MLKLSIKSSDGLSDTAELKLIDNGKEVFDLLRAGIQNVIVEFLPNRPIKATLTMVVDSVDIVDAEAVIKND